MVSVIRISNHKNLFIPCNLQVTLRKISRMILCKNKLNLNASQRTKFAEKIHKPPLWINVITFELNGLNASIWVPWSPSDPQKSWCTDRSIQIHKKQASFLHLHSVAKVYAVFPFFDVKCLCFGGREWGREESHSH